MSTLASADWSKPARRLLESTKELDPRVPAIMHIRHTARTTVTREEIDGGRGFKGLDFLSTPVGIQAAIDFGASLPKDRDVTLYHTYVERARETAEGIRLGVSESGGEARIAGIIPYKITLDREAWERWLVSHRWYPQDGAYDATRLWTAGHVPLNILKPSLEFAQAYAILSMENLHKASGDALHVYVTHDHLVSALIFHWFGMPLYTDGIRYLEGFLMQVIDRGLRAWMRDRTEVFDLPHWWPKQV